MCILNCAEKKMSFNIYLFRETSVSSQIKLRKTGAKIETQSQKFIGSGDLMQLMICSFRTEYMQLSIYILVNLSQYCTIIIIVLLQFQYQAAL